MTQENYYLLMTKNFFLILLHYVYLQRLLIGQIIMSSLKSIQDFLVMSCFGEVNMDMYNQSMKNAQNFIVYKVYM